MRAQSSSSCCLLGLCGAQLCGGLERVEQGDRATKGRGSGSPNHLAGVGLTELGFGRGLRPLALFDSTEPGSVVPGGSDSRSLPESELSAGEADESLRPPPSGFALSPPPPLTS